MIKLGEISVIFGVRFNIVIEANGMISILIPLVKG